MIPLLIMSAIIGRDGLVYHEIVSPYLRPIDNAVYLLSPYIFGMFCSRYYDSIMQTVERWHSAILIAVLVAMVVSIEIRDTREIIPSYRFIFKIIACPLIVYYLKIFQKKIWAGMSVLADYSFGIFFIHGFVLAAHRLALKHFDLPVPHGNIVIVILYSAVVLAICTGALWTVRKLAGANSRALVGC
jgi:peptidoglycan/LPS O-acetylase OafA/YrhL